MAKISLISMRKSRTESAQAHLSFTVSTCDWAVSQAVQGIRTVMKLLALGDDWIFRMELSLHEALLNSYIHGNRADPVKKIWVSCFLSPTKVEIEVEDEGQGYDPTLLPLRPEPERLGGRGLFLIRQSMHSVTVSKKGNQIRMSLRKE